MARICIVDDEEIVRDSLAVTLTREDHIVDAFADPVEALHEIKSNRFDLVVSDLKMPRMDGIKLIREMRSAACDTPMVMMTAFATVSTAVEAIKLGAFDYLQKPFEADQIAVVVDRALEHSQLRKENEALRATIGDLRCRRELIGSGGAMTALRGQLDRISSSNATVLIMGESGTGKELAAWRIHAGSPRGDKPMMCLNCAALSENLLESELFGHERGSYTGADRTRKGRFELADGGALLLDEISEMALPLQAKLLRVMQEGEFERVGSSVTRRADVRVIATTNRNLGKWVEKKRFREDLFYRLNVLPVTLPPLRERVEDIPELVEFFLKDTSRRDGTGELSVSPPAMQLLKEYYWLGNVRELENICRRAGTLSTGGVMSVELVEPWLSASQTRSVEGFNRLREGRMLQDMERQLVERTLARLNGHRARSAKALGMGVRTLSMKLKQWREEDSAETGSMVAVMS